MPPRSRRASMRMPKTRPCEWLVVVVVCAAASLAARPAGTPSEGAFLAEDAAAMKKMMAAMDVEPSGDVDADFVATMVPHHQGAIEMAQAELRHGRNEALRRLAQEIVVEQTEEIAAMRLAQGGSIPAAHLSAFDLPAGQASGAATAPDAPISHRDRVYAAEQFSNTVSVTDPADNRLLGVLRLGDPQPGNFSPLYKGQVLVHGMGFSPDHKTLAVVSIGSNSVTFIDTATNAVKHVTYVG